MSGDRIYYLCERCGEGFSLEDAARIYEDDQAVTACPNCGSANIEEAHRCRRCGDIVYPWNIRSGVCPECLTEAVLALRHKLDELPEDVREIINDEFGDPDVTR